ncbi:MAG TPA: hypothetical protein VM261_16970 [Kofleriaceae bacterium]|nr:hypothetical protein [Kofleriaceae bacterium]
MKQFALAFTVLAFSLTVAACTEPEPDDATITDELLSAGDFDPDELEAEIRFYCPGIDRAAGVPNYRGLTGTYVRLGLPSAEEAYRISFASLMDLPYTAGTFSGLRGTAAGTLAPYAGAFRAFPDNPAIGAAFALDVGADGRFDEAYFVLGLRRSLGGTTITGICLAGREHPFLLSRTYF